ncbi:MAG: 4,5-DOPA dioxygenase extradiol [Planctomycetes bacterium]|nr:4,5-DOPA dioxygenase extradiol [Planctomycetota bacterium]
MTSKLPVLFVGHGSPMNAINDNIWSRGFRALGQSLPRPTSILCVSAHWYVPATLVANNSKPRTIHDFGGFPDELYQVQYPAPGSPALAVRVAELTGAEQSDAWGLDHGTWSVLRHMYPNADIPVVQLSIDLRIRGDGHLKLGRAMAPLREEGVLIVGSGNITHNLRHAFGAMQSGETRTPEWAARFDDAVVSAVTRHDHDWLTRALATADGQVNHPTPDHYLPLLYVAGAARETDRVTFPVTGFDLASLSMRCVQWG